ncbi:MAG TPA: hypothetical protein VMV43_00475 [Candidatus Nanopelagicaceae bacterium]|nr:hypothetical protein [Candidatus Nanopelagicaceae bacterium]
MDSDSTNDEKELFSKNYLFLLRKQKVQKEIEAARRLIEIKVDTLEIADKFIHSTFELMRDGISTRNVDLTEEEIQQRIRNNLSFKEKLKAIKRRYNHLG